MRSVNIYRGDSVFLAVLGESGWPRTVCGQLCHDHGSRIGGHCPGGEEGSRGSSAERRRPASAGRIGNKTATSSYLTGERVLCERPILVAMSMALLMPSLSDDSQCRNADNGKLAEHVGRCAPLVMYLIISWAKCFLFLCILLIEIVKVERVWGEINSQMSDW